MRFSKMESADHMAKLVDQPGWLDETISLRIFSLSLSLNLFNSLMAC